MLSMGDDFSLHCYDQLTDIIVCGRAKFNKHRTIVVRVKLERITQCAPKTRLKVIVPSYSLLIVQVAYLNNIGYKQRQLKSVN